MALNLSDKKVIVSEVSKVAKEAVSFVAADYSGLSVPEMTELRNEARNSGVYLRVVRNTLARRAVEGTDFECVQSSLVGPLILAFAEDEPSAPARLFKRFAADNKKFEVKVLSVGGSVISAEHIDKVATLPTKDEAISKLMSVMLAPVTKMVRTFVAPNEKLVRTLAAVRDKKQSES